MAAFSACSSRIDPSEAIVCIPSKSERSSTAGNSSIPEWHMNALKPAAPRSCCSGRRSTLPATRPPQSPKSTNEDAETAASFVSKDGPSTVTGTLLSGMST